MKLFENQNANGDSEIFSLNNWDEGEDTEVIVNGRYYVAVTGTWDTATATVHVSTDGINWSEADDDATFTENGGVWVELPRRQGQIKVTLASVGGSTDIDADIFSK